MRLKHANTCAIKYFSRTRELAMSFFPPQKHLLAWVECIILLSHNSNSSLYINGWIDEPINFTQTKDSLAIILKMKILYCLLVNSSSDISNASKLVLLSTYNLLNKNYIENNIFVDRDLVAREKKNRVFCESIYNWFLTYSCPL